MASGRTDHSRAEPAAAACSSGVIDKLIGSPAFIDHWTLKWGDLLQANRKYLGEKGIDASRVTTRTGAGQAGATDNRRIDVVWVPEGATY